MAAGIFLAAYIGWTLWHSSGKVGDACDDNGACRSKICLKEQGRLIQYCTVRCEIDAECPDGWKCLASPDLAGRQLCIMP